MLPNFMGPIQPSHYIQMTPDPKFVEQLKRKREAIANICKAVETYMCLDLDLAIETANDPIPQPSFPSYYSHEMLMQAVTQRDNIQDQIGVMEGKLEEMPEMLQAYCEAMAILPLKNQLKEKEEYISRIQAELEKVQGGGQESAT